VHSFEEYPRFVEFLSFCRNIQYEISLYVSLSVRSVPFLRLVSFGSGAVRASSFLFFYEFWTGYLSASFEASVM